MELPAATVGVLHHHDSEVARPAHAEPGTAATDPLLRLDVILSVLAQVRTLHR